MNRHLLVPMLGLCLLTGLLVSRLPAQGVPPVNPRPQQGQPPAAQPKPEANQVSPEMEEILKVWETYSVKLEKLEGKFERYQYDYVTKIEKRSDGTYYYEAPDKGRMNFVPPKQYPETETTRNMTFQVKPDYSQSWICTGKEILDVNEDGKTYNRIEIPEQFQGKNIIESPLPFLFGMKAEEVKRRYLLAFGDFHNTKQGKIHIVAAPLLETQRREYLRVEVLLKTQDFLPEAVRLWWASGNGETVYVFNKHATRTLPWIPSPFQGKLSGYQMLENVRAQPPDKAAQAIIPNGTIQRTADREDGVGRTQLK